mmetsp:Transcript_98409/g.283997  ORF Transcript_98409/g.283997 Transcript_98409/m.283997 type:complete len:216 (-) Transcript_98409:718-1365(-)
MRNAAVAALPDMWASLPALGPPLPSEALRQALAGDIGEVLLLQLGDSSGSTRRPCQRGLQGGQACGRPAATGSRPAQQRRRWRHQVRDGRRPFSGGDNVGRPLPLRFLRPLLRELPRPRASRDLRALAAGPTAEPRRSSHAAAREGLQRCGGPDIRIGQLRPPEDQALRRPGRCGERRCSGALRRRCQKDRQLSHCDDPALDGARREPPRRVGRH